jgi:hypothetical protein
MRIVFLMVVLSSIFCNAAFAEGASQQTGVKGGLVQRTEPVAGNQAGVTGRSSFYDSNELPPVETLQDQLRGSIEPGKWCNITPELVKSWKQEWDSKYKGKVSPTCANLFLEWKKTNACSKKPVAAEEWKPNTSWPGEGKKNNGTSIQHRRFPERKTVQRL